MLIPQLNELLPSYLLKCQFKLYNVDIILLIGNRQSGKTSWVIDMYNWSKERNSTSELYFFHSPIHRSFPGSSSHQSIPKLLLRGTRKVNTIFVDEITDLSDDQLLHLIDHMKPPVNGIIVGTGTLPKKGTTLYTLIIKYYPELVL